MMKPEEQRLIIRLLLMVPFYTIFDLLAYTFIQQYIYFTTIRDAYQAASIIAFFNLLLEYLGPTGEDRQIKLSTIQSTRMPLPFCCWYFNPSKHHRLFLPASKISVIQYVFILYITTFIILILQTAGIYCKGSWSVHFPQIYLVIVQTVSSIVANLSMVKLIKISHILRTCHLWYFIDISDAILLICYDQNILFEAVRGDLIHQQLTLKDICVNWVGFILSSSSSSRRRRRRHLYI